MIADIDGMMCIFIDRRMAYEKTDKLHIVTAVAVIRRDDGRILLLKRRDDERVFFVDTDQVDFRDCEQPDA